MIFLQAPKRLLDDKRGCHNPLPARTSPTPLVTLPQGGSEVSRVESRVESSSVHSEEYRSDERYQQLEKSLRAEYTTAMGNMTEQYEKKQVRV
jgi:hypothetical protein